MFQFKKTLVCSLQKSVSNKTKLWFWNENLVLVFRFNTFVPFILNSFVKCATENSVKSFFPFSYLHLNLRWIENISSLFLSLSLSLSLTHASSPYLSLSRTLTHTLSLPLTHIHTRTFSLSLFTLSSFVIEWQLLTGKFNPLTNPIWQK